MKLIKSTNLNNRKFLQKLSNTLLNIEHTIYCMTQCKVEGLLHRKYYAYRRDRYNHYLKTNHPNWVK